MLSKVSNFIATRFPGESSPFHQAEMGVHIFEEKARHGSSDRTLVIDQEEG